MARTRTTKKLAQRIDLNYFKRPTAWKRTRLWLCVLVPVLALVWIAWRGSARDSRVYSSGRLSRAHAVLEKRCEACHVQKAGFFSEKTDDRACLSCHDGPIHHAGETKTLACAACHVEHRGHVKLTATRNETCAECHGNLHTSQGASSYAAHIRSFADGHPQFAALREGQHDPGTIKLNHAVHMKLIRRGPNGPMVQLTCGDCHRPAAVQADWPYADPNYVNAQPTYRFADEARVVATGATLPPRNPSTGRELMAPVKFATACAGCHLLTFDKRFEEGVPHDAPEVVHLFLVKKFQQYIAAHPAELRVVRDPSRDLTGKPLQPETRVLTPTQWVTERTAAAEELLWRKTCKQCHTMVAASGEETTVAVGGLNSQVNAELPRVAPANVTTQWMPHAKFDHDAHRGFACTNCHQKALNSSESSNLLLPGIAVCQTCHAPGPEHAESRCFECHTYHDWSKRKEVTPSFMLSGLTTGDQ